MKVVLGEQEFEIDDELKFSAINRLCSWDRTTYAAGISNFLGEWEINVNMRKYLENWEFGFSGM
jgi:hypothetical protein